MSSDRKTFNKTVERDINEHNTTPGQVYVGSRRPGTGPVRNVKLSAEERENKSTATADKVKHAWNSFSYVLV